VAPPVAYQKSVAVSVAHCKCLQHTPSDVTTCYMDAALFTLSTLDTPQMCDGFQHWHSCVTAAAGQATQPNPRFIKMRHDPLHIYICLNDQEYEGHVGLVGGPAQSASQLLRAMRLDRGLPNGREGLDRGLSKGREDLTERQQQTHMSMGGTPGRLTGQGHQARYHPVFKYSMCVPACKLHCCAQISLASIVDAVAFSIVGVCMPFACATAISVSQTLCCICIRWLPYHLIGACYESNYMPRP